MVSQYLYTMYPAEPEDVREREKLTTYFEMKNDGICEDCRIVGEIWRIYNAETFGIELCVGCFRKNFSRY